MLVHTKTRHTRRASAPKSKAKAKSKAKSTHWREVFKEELEKYGDPGLMLSGCRHKAGLTQKELADAVGISQNHISEMENGKRTIGKVMALRFAKHFDTDYRKFL
ncbi:MAG TPA: helix-turn-helix transcriptional regulator [Rhabdochlamydiaceae bacterium]|nr:helix-turn-helix transcriptional regulator [Rhabdochlamydiaceae bacterium]